MTLPDAPIGQPHGQSPSLDERTPDRDQHWWRHAVTYQVYIRSFADTNGDGLGDVPGICSKLPYLRDLGVDALWINPWYPSPQADAGYDVADYRDIDPAFGTLDDARHLIDTAHGMGLKVLLDVVPNHTSDEHAWFVEALAAGPGSPERDRYLFRDGRGPDGAQPPNAWHSVFGGPAWTRVSEADGSPGQWYLHLFDTKQPDLNWDNAWVRDQFEDILRFWFDLGADGFRIDVAHGLIKDPELPDLLSGSNVDTSSMPTGPDGEAIDHPHWDRPEVHEVYRRWRAVAETYSPPRVFVGETWVSTPERLARYLRPDELHSAFDFDFVMSPWNAQALRRDAASSLAAHDQVGAPVTWVLSNHDITRHVSRMARPTAREERAALPGEMANARERQGPLDLPLGRRRARAMLLLELALPGAVYLYQGEELGLEEVEDLPEDLLQDPVWQRSGGTERGRDGCRVPVPWTTSGPSLGFSEVPGWLPQPSSWAGPDGLSAQAQQDDPASMLSFYRRALHQRADLVRAGSLGDGGNTLVWLDTTETPDVLAFRRVGGTEEQDGGSGHTGSSANLICVVNTGTEPVSWRRFSPNGKVLLTSVEADPNPDLLPGDSAMWVLEDHGEV